MLPAGRIARWLKKLTLENVRMTGADGEELEAHDVGEVISR